VVLKLLQTDIANVADDSDILMAALEKTADYVTENMAPTCDFSPIFCEIENPH
jgi:hypothetical protein